MSRFHRVVLLTAASFLGIGLSSSPGSAAGHLIPSSREVSFLREEILAENSLYTAECFLADTGAQGAVKDADPDAYLAVFARATELVDLKGLLGSESTVHSIRQGLSRRTRCAFCLDGTAFPAWAKANMGGLGAERIESLGKVLWNWDRLTPAQKAWAAARGKEAAWPGLAFPARHEVMRAWALSERDAMLTLSPADADAAEDFSARAYELSQVLGSHEMSALWKRSGEVTQSFQSLAEARARVAMSDDPRQKALLSEALGAASPEARLSALARIFENYGERPAALLAAAPPRVDQRFDADSRKLVGAMLKSAMLKETEGTFAGDDLKEFYARVPLEVAFTTTSMSALGWYHHGGDTLYFNERYVEEYLKTQGVSVETLKRDPALLQNLARLLVPTFVHETQHHRQDVWARDNKMPRLYHQGDEVEAFQVGSLFTMQKLRVDKKYAAWAAEEAKSSYIVAVKLAQARRMELEGPGYFDRVIPNTHYPETYSNEANAWCEILWHNSVAEPIEAELARRGRLDAAARKKLEDAAPALKASYPTADAFRADLLRASSATLDSYLQGARKGARNAANHYNQLRGRQEAVAATTRERYDALEPPGGVPPPRGIDALPGPDEERP